VYVPVACPAPTLRRPPTGIAVFVPVITMEIELIYDHRIAESVGQVCAGRDGEVHGIAGVAESLDHAFADRTAEGNRAGAVCNRAGGVHDNRAAACFSDVAEIQRFGGDDGLSGGYDHRLHVQRVGDGMRLTPRP
jgi:hypothetical protein